MVYFITINVLVDGGFGLGLILAFVKINHGAKL